MDARQQLFELGRAIKTKVIYIDGTEVWIRELSAKHFDLMALGLNHEDHEVRAETRSRVVVWSVIEDVKQPDKLVFTDADVQVIRRWPSRLVADIAACPTSSSRGVGSTPRENRKPTPSTLPLPASPRTRLPAPGLP